MDKNGFTFPSFYYIGYGLTSFKAPRIYTYSVMHIIGDSDVKYFVSVVISFSLKAMTFVVNYVIINYVSFSLKTWQSTEHQKEEEMSILFCGKKGRHAAYDEHVYKDAMIIKVC